MMMPLPPEKFGVSPADIRTEIGAFLKDNPQADGSTAEDIILIPDSLTLRTVGDALSGKTVQPDYRAVTKSGDLVVDAHGTPFRYGIASNEELSTRIVESQRQAEAAERTKNAERIAEAKRARADLPGLNERFSRGALE